MKPKNPVDPDIAEAQRLERALVRVGNAISGASPRVRQLLAPVVARLNRQLVHLGLEDKS